MSMAIAAVAFVDAVRRVGWCRFRSGNPSRSAGWRSNWRSILTNEKMRSDEQVCWRYERGEGRHKHRWANDYAGFQPGSKGPVGKCPNSIDETLAERILNQEIPFFESEDDAFPTRIYAVYRGVIYEAVPTTPGVSWHGYPWRGDLPGRAPLPRRIRNRLEEQAKAAGDLQEFKRWLKKYG